MTPVFPPGFLTILKPVVGVALFLVTLVGVCFLVDFLGRAFARHSTDSGDYVGKHRAAGEE